jgi:hypothetical protein
MTASGPKQNYSKQSGAECTKQAHEFAPYTHNPLNVWPWTTEVLPSVRTDGVLTTTTYMLTFSVGARITFQRPRLGTDQPEIGGL